MPRKNRRTKVNFAGRSRRRQSTPNVYIQEDDPEASDVSSEDDSLESALTSDATPGSRTSRSRSRRATRRGRNAPLRAAVYAEYLPRELRKLGVLTGGLAVILIALTVVIG
jgi:hypothetical protein